MRFVNIKTLLLIAVIVVLLFIIKNIIGSIMSLRQNSHIVTSLKQQEQAEKQKGQFLKEKLHQVNTVQFIENEARERLGMVKAGEHVVLAPPAVATASNPTVIDYSPNWQKWWKLFF